MKKNDLIYRASLLGLVLLLSWFQGEALLAQPTVQAGLRAGVMTSNFYGDDVTDVSVRSHINGGLFVTYRFSDYLGLQPEVLFAAKGARVGSPSMGQADDVTYHLGYLEIPLLAKVFLPATASLQPSIILGPALDIKLYGEADDNNLEGQVKNLDYLAVGGINLSYGVGNVHLRQRQITFDARYILGFNKVFDMEGNPDFRNQSFSFTLGFSL